MRKKFFIFCCAAIFILLGIILFLAQFQKPYQIVSPVEKQNVPTTPTQTAIKQKLLFIPYWNSNFSETNLQEFNKAIYFSISANEEGIDTSSLGYKNIANFIRNVGSKEKLLTVQLTNQTINDVLLQNKDFQNTVIHQSIMIAKQYGFSGIVVDFEFNALSFDSVVKNIDYFYNNFSSQAKQQKLQFYSAIYGDTFYRARPYDIKTISSLSDGIFVMAYDFHKINGNPGPNFPLNQLPTEDYSFKEMVSDFLHFVSPQKITIIYGLYGYDWKVTQKGDSVGSATAISLADIQKKFYPICPFSNCKIIHDVSSQETNILYSDQQGNLHSLWFEDMNSIAKKSEFLTSKEIGSTAYWIFGYY